MTDQPDDRPQDHAAPDDSFLGDVAQAPRRARTLGGLITLLAVVIVGAFIVPQWFGSDTTDVPTAPPAVNTAPASASECPATDGLLAKPPAGWVTGPRDALITDASPSRIVVCAYSGVGQPDITQKLTRATAVTNANVMALDLSRIQAVFADAIPCTYEMRDTDRDQFLVAVTSADGTVVWLDASGSHCGRSITNGAFVTDAPPWAQLTQTAATGVWPSDASLPIPTTTPSTPAIALPECPSVDAVTGQSLTRPVTVPVPEATASGADAALARSDAPLAATVCGYSIHAMRTGATPDPPTPSLLGRIAVSNPDQLAADLHAAKPWSGERGCTLIGGAIDRYLIALTYPDGVIWVGVEDEPNHCLPASNGRFTADENLGEDVARAFDSGVWKGDDPVVSCPEVPVGALPPAVSHVGVPAAPTVPGADAFLASTDVPRSGYVCTYDIVGADGVVPSATTMVQGTATWLQNPDALSSDLAKARPRGSTPLTCDSVTGPEKRHLVHFTYPAGELWVAIEQSESGCARAWNGAFEADVNLGTLAARLGGSGSNLATDWPGTASEGFAVSCVNSYDAQGRLVPPATTSTAAQRAMVDAKSLVSRHPDELPMAAYCSNGEAVQLLYVMDGTAGQTEAEAIREAVGVWEGAHPGVAEIRSGDPPPSFAKLVVARVEAAPASLGVSRVRYDPFTGVVVVTVKAEASGGTLAARVAKVRALAEPGPNESWPMEVPVRIRTGVEVTVG